MVITKSILFFFAAGLWKSGEAILCGFGSEKAKLWHGLGGALVLILYGVIPTFQPQTSDVYMRRTEEYSLPSRFCGAGELIRSFRKIRYHRWISRLGWSFHHHVCAQELRP